MANLNDSSMSSYADISLPATAQRQVHDHIPNVDAELDDLPSPSEPDSDELTTSDDLDENTESDAEREWRESIQQFELLLGLVIVPYAGKYFGRKFAFWGWKRFMEWRYPVEVVVTSPAAFKGTGAIGVAAAL